MDEKIQELVRAGQIWDNLSVGERYEIFKEMLVTSKAQDKLPFIDFSLGPTTPWSKLRANTKWAFFSYLRREEKEIIKEAEKLCFLKES